MAITQKKANNTGLKDGFLTALFAVLSYAGLTLGGWIISALPGIDLGKWEPIKLPIVLIVTALLKGKDRAVHEDPTTPATGLIKL